MATLNFDATQVEPSAAKEPLPAGRYLAAIQASTMKPTKTGVGQYLELEYQVLDGPAKGRRLWSRHNLVHPNEQTVLIARGELSAICRAVQVLAPRDSAELHDKPLLLTVIRRKRDTGELSNEVTAWGAREAMPSAAQSGPTTPAWMRR